MERILIFALGCTLAGASLKFTSDEAYLAPGKEYVSRYEAQVATGVGESSHMFSGLKIKANVRIQSKDGGKFIFQMEAIEVFKVNDELPTGLPVKVIPDDMMQRVTSERGQILTMELSKPFECKYDNGDIIEFKTAKNDPYWSANIKRGFVNLFKIELKQKKTLTDRVEIPYSVRDVIKAKLLKGADLKPVYSTMEYGVVGKCESIYAMTGDQVPVSGKQEFTLTKIRNYKHCEEKPSLQNTVLYGPPCAGCDEPGKMSLLEAYSHTDYVFEGNVYNYVIKKAVLEGHYVFLPFSEAGGSVRTHMIQSWELVKIGKVGTAIPEITESYVKLGHPLVYEFPHIKSMINSPVERQESEESESSWSWYEKKPAGGAASASMATEKLKKKVEDIIRREIAPLMKTHLKAELPKKIAELVVYLRVYAPQLVDHVVTECVVKAPNTEDGMHIRKLILDILPTIGTDEAAIALKMLIKKRVISGVAAAQAINSLSLVAVPTPAIIEILLDVVAEPALLGARIEKETAMLTAGALVRQWRKIVIRNRVPVTKIIPLEQKLIKRFLAILKASKEEREIIASLKAIGNTGMPDFLRVLTLVAKDEAKPTAVRAQAIYSLRYIAKIVPRKIQTVLLPLLTAPALAEDVRVAAYLMVMETRPGFGVLQMIVHRLKIEPNIQVASFIYTHMRSLSRTRHPCYKKEATAAKVALLVARPVEWALQYSRTIHAEFGNRILNFGSAMDIFVINKRDSLMPHAVTARFDNLIFDHSAPFEAGISITGLQSVLRRLLAKKHMTSLYDLTLKDILEPMKTMYSSTVQGKLRTIFEKVSVNSKASAIEPYISMYAKMFGSEMQYYLIDKVMMESMAKSVREVLKNLDTKLSQGVPIDYHKTMALFDVASVIPTPLGLPVTMNMTILGSLKLKGKLSGEVSPSIQQLRSTWSLPESAKIKMDVTPSMAMEACVATGVDLNFVRSGAAVRMEVAANVPLSSIIDADLKNNKLAVSVKVPKEMKTSMRNMMTMKVLPLTQTLEAPTAILADLSDNSVFVEKTIMNKKAYLEKTEKSVGREALGLAVECVIEKAVRRSITAPYHPLSGPITIAVNTRPGVNVPSALLAQFTYESDAPTASGIRRKRSILTSLTSLFNNDDSDVISSIPRRILDDTLFSAVTPSPLLTSPITRKVLALFSVEGPIKREIKARCVVMSDIVKSVHQLDVQAVTSAIHGVCTEPKKLVLTTLLKTDVPSETSYIWSAPSTEKVAAATIDLLAGPVATPIKRVTAKVSLETSNSPIEGKSTDETVLNLKTEITHNKLPPMIINILRMCHAQMKYRLHNNMQTTFKTPTDVAPKKILMEIETRSISRKMSMVLDLPSEMNRVTYECPIAWPTIDAEKPLVERTMSTLMRKHIPATCSVESDDKVVTFDRSELYLPSHPGCELVLAKDCSPEKAFVVLISRPTNAPLKKVVKLYALGHKVELAVSSWSPEIKIDDRRLPTESNPRVQIHKISTDPKSPVLLDIKHDAERTVVECKALGLTLKVEGKTIVLKASTMLHGVTCGLCGNNNGDKTDYFYDRNMITRLSRDDIFARSLVPSDTCKIKELYPHVKVPVPTI